MEGRHRLIRSQNVAMAGLTRAINPRSGPPGNKAKRMRKVTKKTTKHKTTPTQPARLSTYEKKTLAEVDWDLLAEMDAEDEGQPVPMRDNPSTKNPAQDASPDPDRQLDDGVMQESSDAKQRPRGPLTARPRSSRYRWAVPIPCSKSRPSRLRHLAEKAGVYGKQG